MIKTILMDGRTVKAEECRSLADALDGGDFSRPEIVASRTDWFLTCQCCRARSEHPWSPSGQGVDPDEGHYPCEPCAGTGEFKILMP
jgi:hypothetical protein